jgi:hypothetical protein
MIVYLAAVQQARLVDKKINTSVFGIITDSDEFKFVFLDSAMKLFSSEVFVWGYKTNEILQWIDRILTDAIDASPYTAPVQSRNTTLFTYETALQRHHHLGAGSSSEGMAVVDRANVPPVNIFLKRDREYREVDRVRYRGRDLIILEHESDDEESDEEEEDDDGDEESVQEIAHVNTSRWASE